MLAPEIDIQIEPKLLKLLENGVDAVMPEIVNEVAAWGESKLSENATKFVYSEEESPNYERTGALKRGHESNFSRKTSSSKAQAKIIPDSRIGGAQTNYSPAVNDGYEGTQDVRAHSRRTKSGGQAKVKAHTRTVKVEGRPFIDETVKDVKEEAPRITNWILGKYIKGL